MGATDDEEDYDVDDDDNDIVNVVPAGVQPTPV